MSEITHLINVNASPRPHETVRGIVSGIETGKGIETETAIGGTLLVDDTDLRLHGSGIENEREMPQDGHTKKKKKRRNHQSHFLPLFLGLSARCLNRQSLMVGLMLLLPAYHQH